MPTPAGWGVLAASVGSAVLGRAVAAPILFVLAASMIAAVVAGVASVGLRPPRLVAARSVRPDDLGVGQPAEVEVTITDRGLLTTPALAICDRIMSADGEPTERWFTLDRSTRIGRTRHHRLVYPLDTARRGVFLLGPLEAERTDLLGLARRRIEIGATDEVVVAPRTVAIAVPIAGYGDFGLRPSAVPSGVGDFAGLRAYRPGDEPRTIHWAASARTGGLKVREYITEDVRRCTIVLDTSSVGATATGGVDDRLELVVSIAASLVAAATAAGLMTRLVTSAGHDLRGRDIASAAGRVLARIGHTGPIARIGRDPADGRALAAVVALSVDEAQRLGRVVGADVVLTADPGAASVRTGRRLIGVDSLEEFAAVWHRIVRSSGTP